MSCQVDDDYFPIVESAMDDSREALQRLCQQDASVDPRMPPNVLNDSVSYCQRVRSVACCVCSCFLSVGDLSYGKPTKYSIVLGLLWYSNLRVLLALIRLPQVNQLDLRAYADELQRQGEGKRAAQLDGIVEEIRYPFRYCTMDSEYLRLSPQPRCPREGGTRHQT